MSVLGTVSKRLQTDLADLSRAAIDPVYSQQLTKATFQKDRDARQRQQALEDQAQARAAKEREDTFNIQKTILIKAKKMPNDLYFKKSIVPSYTSVELTTSSRK